MKDILVKIISWTVLDGQKRNRIFWKTAPDYKL